MKMRDAHTGGWRACLKITTLSLVAAALLLHAPPVRAESEQPASAAAPESSGGEPGQASPSPGLPAATEPAPPSAPAPVQPAPAGAAVSPGSGAYVTPLPSTALGALTAGSAPDATAPVVVSRSGGLPSLIFDNKLSNWLSTSLTVAESYDSNPLLRSVKQDDFITRVSPALAFRYQNQLLDWNLGSSLDYRYYARNTRTEDLSYALNTSGRIKLYRDYAFINISDSYTQTSQSTAVDYTAQSSSVNVTDLNTLRLTPRMEIPVTSRIRFNPQYGYSNYWYPSKSQQNRQSHAVSADFSYEISPSLSPALGYSFVRTEGDLLRYNQHYPYLRVVFRNDRVTLNGSVGYSRLDLDAGGTSQKVVWDVSLAYRLPTVNFTLETSSDVDQSSYLNNSSGRKVPEIVTRYMGSMTREFRKSTLTLRLYFRENTDGETSDLITRQFGTSVALTQTITPRLSGVLTGRLERNDTRRFSYSDVWMPVGGGIFLWDGTVWRDQGGTQSLLYQLGYILTYSFGNDWAVAGNYSYTDSASPNTVSYTANKVGLSVSKSF